MGVGPPNTPLAPHCSQEKELSVQRKNTGFLLWFGSDLSNDPPVFVYFIVNSRGRLFSDSWHMMDSRERLSESNISRTMADIQTELWRFTVAVFDVPLIKHRVDCPGTETKWIQTAKYVQWKSSFQSKKDLISWNIKRTPVDEEFSRKQQL